MRFTKNPEHPTDLLDKPLAEGDFVAYPYTSGSSARMSIGQIERINFKRKKVEFDGFGNSREVYGENEDCHPRDAEWYTVAIRRFKSTDGYRDREPAVKPTLIHKVENLVKVEMPDGE